jgi:hypothetical protein
LSRVNALYFNDIAVAVAVVVVVVVAKANFPNDRLVLFGQMIFVDTTNMTEIKVHGIL